MDAAKFPDFQSSLFKALVSTTRAATILGAQDLAFHRSLDPSFGDSLDECSTRLLELTNSLVKIASADAADTFHDEDDLNDRWGDVVDVVDTLLEKSDVCIDEFTGATKKNKVAQGAAGVTQISKTGKAKERLDYNLVHAENIVRPQLNFKIEPDNSESAPWKWKLTSKPNAIVPLKDLASKMDVDDSEELPSLPHPYEPEITQTSYPAAIYEQKEPIPPKPFAETSASWVDSQEKLMDMLEELKKADVIAIDLEHHDYRSYQGFVCLMQISTRDQDWLIDTLELREELEVLNEVFTDPKIIKVLHGASMDIVWLQRDFGLYIVGLFDTYFASKVLNYEGHGLAYLLKKFEDFDADKRYQLADWRIRPLPPAMSAYARSDTHFLLHIFDHLRNELLAGSNPTTQNLMESVLGSSRQTALKIYEKDVYDTEGGLGKDGWRNLLMKSGANRILDKKQLAVFKALHRWRDQVARQEDESVRFILPNHMLVTLSSAMPDDVPGVLSSCNPTPPYIRMSASDVVAVIQAAKETVEEDLPTAAAVTAIPVSAPAHTRFLDAEATAAADLKLTPFIDVFAQQEKAEKLVSSISAFWGKLTEPVPESDGKQKAMQIIAEMRLAVPLPPLTAQVYEGEDEDVKMEEGDAAALAEHPFVKKQQEERERAKREREEIITVRQLGRKRKSDVVDNEPERPESKDSTSIMGASVISPGAGTGEESDHIPDNLNLDPATPGPAKKKAKRDKKKSKAPKKVESAEAEAPFDYAAAAPLYLDQPHVDKRAEKKKDKKKQKNAKPAHFNPHAAIEEHSSVPKRDANQLKNKTAPQSGNKSMYFN
ncbi:exosome nuclease subunit [Saitoella coloradoensis]